MRRAVQVVVTGVVVGLLVSLPHVLGLSYYRIGSGSMEPVFPVGTIVIDSARLSAEPHRAATFTADGKIVTHVVVGYNPDGSLITRGIANRHNDAWRTPVYGGDVRGRVLFALPVFAPSFWIGRSGILLVLGLAMLAAAVHLGRVSTSRWRLRAF